LTTTYYYVNSFDNTTRQWTEVGASPWLDTINYPTAYIHTTSNTKTHRAFGFPNSGAENAETLTKVELELYCMGEEDPDVGTPSISVYISDGVTWTSMGNMPTPLAWAWVAKDITSKINTWAKLDACQLYVISVTPVGMHIWLDAARLKATSTPVAGAAKKRLLVGVGL
jgi:hypothetical protein